MPFAQHELDVLALPAAGKVQCGHAVGADGVSVGAGQQKDCDDRLFVALHRVHQRGSPLPVAGFHVCAGLQEYVNCGVIASPGGYDDRWCLVGTALVGVRTVREEKAQCGWRDGTHDRGDKKSSHLVSLR